MIEQKSREEETTQSMRPTSQSVNSYHGGESRTAEVVGLPAPSGPSMTENIATQKPNAAKRKVQRHSPDRLLRKKLVLPGEITVSAEKHRGRLVVRVESPDDER